MTLILSCSRTAVYRFGPKFWFKIHIDIEIWKLWMTRSGKALWTAGRGPLCWKADSKKSFQYSPALTAEGPSSSMPQVHVRLQPVQQEWFIDVASICHMLPKHVDSIHDLHFIPTPSRLFLWAKGPEFDFMAGWCFSLAANRRGKGYTCSPCPNEPRTSQRELNQAASFLATICKHRILKVSHWIFKLLLQEGEALRSSNFEAIKHFTSVSMCKQILYYIELIYIYILIY